MKLETTLDIDPRGDDGEERVELLGAMLGATLLALLGLSITTSSTAPGWYMILNGTVLRFFVNGCARC